MFEKRCASCAHVREAFFERATYHAYRASHDDVYSLPYVPYDVLNYECKLFNDDEIAQENSRKISFNNLVH